MRSFKQRLCDFTDSSKLFELEPDDIQDKMGPGGKCFFVSEQWGQVGLAGSWIWSCRAVRGVQWLQGNIKSSLGLSWSPLHGLQLWLRVSSPEGGEDLKKEILCPTWRDGKG